MKIGFIGFGEAAYNLSLGLNEKYEVDIRATDALTDDPVMGEQVRMRAEQAHVKLETSAGEVANFADIVIAAVPSSYTLDACRSAKNYLRRGQLYVDVSASTPEVKLAVWEEIKEKGVLFADAAMLGSLPKDKHRVPIVASGNGAETFEKLMTPYEMKIKTVGEDAGAASAIKLVRSIYMKGISALMIEMLLAAEKYRVHDEVVSSIAESMDDIPFSSHLDRLVAGTAIHCHRRSAELGGSITLLKEAGLPDDMSAAAKMTIERLEPYHFAQRYVNGGGHTAQEIIEVLTGNQN